MDSVTWNAIADYFVGPNYADPRVQDWPLMDWKLPTIISCLYIFGIPLGVRLMKNREPFRLRTFAALHNAFLFALSLYMCIETLTQAYENFGWGKKFSLWCNPVEPGPTFSPSGYRLARVLWIHYISKAYEFVDTVIMVLKKNDRQITFLHVYHHATTFFPVWWANVKFGPGGEAYFCCAYNSFIHVLMYGYYFSATFGVRLGLFKPFITISQMVQFLCYITQAIWILFVKDCYKPRLSSAQLFFQCVIFLALFTNFFINAYLKKPKKKVAAKKE